MILSRNNVVIYAAKHYEVSSSLTVEEFHSDLKKSKLIAKMLRLFSEDGRIQERLLLNNVIAFYNCFGAKAGSNILFMICEDNHPQLKSLTDFLGYTPRVIEYGNKCFHSDAILADAELTRIIKNI